MYAILEERNINIINFMHVEPEAAEVLVVNGKLWPDPNAHTHRGTHRL